MFILISQMLLAALAIAWVIHMTIIAVDGAIYFVENNRFILWTEIASSVLITIFAIFILAAQIRRLGEKRRTDRTDDSRHS